MAKIHEWHRFLISAATLLTVALLLTACDNQQDSKSQQQQDDGGSTEKPIVVTSFTVIADMARNVAGQSATIFSVTKPGAEIHNYQPTPKDIAGTRGASLVLWNGLGLELWFEKFLQQLDGVSSVVVTEGIEPVDIASGPYSGKPNPHAWMSPTDALVYVDNIAKALGGIDPDNRDQYQANADAYKKEISGVATAIRKELEQIPEEDRWLVSSEGAFTYLTRDFGLKELYLWPINADQQGTPTQVRNVIDTVREHKLPVVFSESTISAKPAQQIARETGAHYGGALYVDSLSEGDGPVPTYLDLIRVTSETIVRGLIDGKARQQQ